jgi:hypothetical protein|tara:strand:- start:787 stop:1050 length:264 start_codon:yes stop_codon:yes gene_type:complete
VASPKRPGKIPGNVSIDVLNVRRMDADRAVVHVELGDGISLNSLWVVGLTTPEPSVAWPRTKRGYPIVTASVELRERIDARVLEAVQ